MAKAKKAGTALVSMKDLEKFYAAEAQEAAAAAPIAEGQPRLVAKDYQFSIGERILPDPLNLIVVAEALQNVYYDTEYDPKEKSPPACFAVGPADGPKADDAMAAHATSPNPQGHGDERKCVGCPQNEFGSSPRGGGKACSNTRQLAVVMADDPGLHDGSPVQWAVLSLSPTGLRPWGKFVQGLANIAKRPPHGVVTQFSFNKADPKEANRKAVVAIGYKPITDVAVATRVRDLRKEILDGKLLVRPLPVDGYVPVAERKPAKKSGKPAAKKGRR